MSFSNHVLTTFEGHCQRCLVAEGCLALTFFRTFTRGPSEGIYLLETLQTLFLGGGGLFLAALMLPLHPITEGGKALGAMLTACTTPLSICERSRVARHLCHVCGSDLPTALREAYLLSPTVLWLLCGCGSPCPNAP